MIQQVSLSSSAINGSNDASNQIPTGTTLIYRTYEGRYGKLLIQQYGYTLTIQWLTYNSDGSVYSQGSSLTIAGTYSCDLDLGVQGNWDPPRDFFWEQRDSVVRYIMPINGALFARFTGCLYAISPTSASPEYGASTGSVNVNGILGCSWSATSNSSWVTIIFGDSGTGDGTLGYSVTANPGPGSRAGSLTIAGQTFSITQAAPPTASITVTTNPAGRSFTVDSITYSTAQTFSWVIGSSHAIATTTPQTSGSTRYVFASWSDSQPMSHTITTPSISATYTANFTTQYLLTTAVSPSGSGTISATPSSADGFYNSGASVQLTANLAAGYALTAWSGDLAGTANPQSLTMSAARSVTAAFAMIPAGITITTSPAGRSFSVDGVGYTAAQTFSWTPGSTHTIATSSPQTAGGTRYVFASWSDGQPMNHTITTPSGSTTYTANFSTQYLLTTAVSPSGSGSVTATPASPDGIYNSGTSVQLTANPAAGYALTAWSGDLTGTANPQSLTMSAARNVTATFALISAAITINTGPAGRTFTVDGGSYTTTQTFSWTPGSTHTIATSSPQTAGSTRYVFASWSDGQPMSHSITTPSGSASYTANFTTQYLLTTAVSPSGSGSVTATPASPDGFYNSGTSVQLTANPPTGYALTAWSGDLTGTANPQSLTMSAARNVTATFALISAGITITTSPAGRSFSVDGVGYTAAQTFSWTPGSTHTIATSSPQTAGGTRYVFASWSDGQPMSHTITTPSGSTTYTANFTTQYLLTTAVSPSGSGSVTATPASPDGFYNSGTSVQLTANPTTGYALTAWSGDLTGTADPQSLTMSAARNVTATFALIPAAITINTGPAGRTFTVDGGGYTTTQTFSWTPGSSHTIATSSPQTAGSTRYVFANWSDGGAISHSITTPSGSASYTANFTTQYLLTTAVSPSGSGSVTATPASPDGFYNSGTSVQLTATPSGGIFSGWTGDLTGTINPQLIVMSAPRSVTANFGSCAYSITPSTSNHTAAGGTGSIAVSSSQGCSWTASSNASWISITSGSSGYGPGAVGYSVSVNASSSQRTGTITAAGSPFTVIQAGALTPAISSLQPPLITAGSSGFNLIVTGSNFMNGSVVLWNGQTRPTIFLGATELRATIPAPDIASQGTVQVMVSSPDGGASAARTFTILTNLPPSLAGLSPGRMILGGQGFTMTVTGTNFVPGSKVRWNGQDRPTTFESSNILSAVIPASDIATAGSVPVTVFNPSPGGGTSNGVGFEVLSGTVITDISPSMVAPFGRGFKLTLFGANFLGGTTARANGEIRRQAGTTPTIVWNGQPLNTVQVSSGVLQADVAPGMVGTGGSAMVSVSGGSSGDSNMVPVPITVIQPTPLLTDLSPKSAVPGSSQFTLTVSGKNFVEGSKVLWNGEERQTQFIDSTRIQAIIPGGDISAAGVSEVRVLNPSPGGGESNGRFFSHVQVLLYPRLSSVSRTVGNATDDSERTGIAFTNLGAQEETVTFTAFDTNGTPLFGTDITNPVQITIKPGEQSAVVASQIFGLGLPGRKPIGWFKMESSGGSIPGFFLLFSDTLSLLDGTDVSSKTHTTFIAPEIEPAGFTQFNVVNPDVQPAQLLFELYASDGQLRAPGVQLTLPPGASLVETVANLFPAVPAAVSDYVRVVSNCSVLLFEYMGKPDQDVAALNGQDADAGATALYSPQYAIGGAWRTALSVVNLESRSGVVTFTLRGNNGLPLAAPVVRNIPARGKLSITDQNFFLDSGSNLTQGYVEIRSDGVRLSGSVSFGDLAQSLFVSSLPLVSQLQTDMLFSQLASNQSFYTGIAILNPNTSAVTARIEVYDEKGTLLASKDEPIAAGGRVVNVITEFFPQLRGEDHSLGYIRVRANQGVASFALFGTNNYTALSAVPAQEIR